MMQISNDKVTKVNDSLQQFTRTQCVYFGLAFTVSYLTQVSNILPWHAMVQTNV